MFGSAAVVGATVLLGGGSTASAQGAPEPRPSRATAAEIDAQEKDFLESLKQIADPACDEAAGRSQNAVRVSLRGSPTGSRSS
ncbi:hypothetical protein ADK60_13635 [Streptomyces sp. XY431]|nr:hypothetical protein ADK60_13635 [Streptomyces sp. XY431]